MNRLRLHHAFFLLLSLALPLATRAPRANGAADESARLRIETLAEGVFAFLPTEEAFDTWSAISNSGAVVLDDGVLIFDSHWTPELAREALALLREHTELPVRYVVSSHFHGDHTGGNWAYGEDVVFLSHRATRESLIEEARDLPAQLRAQIAQQEASLEGIEDPKQRARTANFLQATATCSSASRARAPRRCPR